ARRYAHGSRWHPAPARHRRAAPGFPPPKAPAALTHRTVICVLCAAVVAWRALKRNRPGKSSRAKLTLAALGIVFGDIGTSPLYALRETFSPVHGIPLNASSILGGLSTVFWALMIVVSLKYVLLIMRADNRGEGGIMALIALAQSATRNHPEWRLPLIVIGCLGASLFYGDAVLTPAISVLSAVEGLHIGTDIFDPYVVPIAVVVLVALFAFPSGAPPAVGRRFGRIMMVWFLAIGAA